MSSDGSDELGRTATAADPSSPPPASAPLGTTIGRYRLERELGAGGMGVVHVAFDPDLERRVALKVLRGATGGEAAKRLQREARAMARLNHPNVVTVHEVGSVAGRDYVAMELIEGESLAEWLRSSRRPPREIVEAFIAAGRGLAAAHAAGIVHRDFKPHNVLRSRTGRIAVTDFGLARDAYPSGHSDPLAITTPLAGGASGTSTTSNTPSALSGLTVSGSVLGTPAYMAPEQWDGGEVTPATDQFGYCVALWEALTGQRPYRGPTIDDLRAQAAAGPQALDASRIPRRLRKILRRGLDPSAAKRWASMDELLARLAQAERRPWITFAAIGAALVAAGVLVLVLRGRGGGSGCAPPSLDPSVVWPDDAIAVMTAAGQAPATKLFANDHRRWTELRTSACAAEPSQRAALLACLDGVLARFDSVARAASAPGERPIDVGSALIDPSVCGGSSPPRLVGTASPLLQEVIAARLRGDAAAQPASETTVAALAQRTASEPCASALAEMYLAEVTKESTARDRATERADQAADRCGDDRIRAELALSVVDRALANEFVGATFASKLARAEVAVQRVPQSDLIAQLATYRMHLDSRGERIDRAIADGQDAISGFARRGRIAAQITAGLSTVWIRQTRGTPEDVASIASSLRGWRALATSELGADHPILREIEAVDAGWAWANGDASGGHARLAALHQPRRIDSPRHVRGIVVDASGAPVAGANVVTGKDFSGDGFSPVLAMGDVGHVRTTTTGADGRFDLAESVSDGIAIAQLGDRRSAPVPLADTVQLVLAPTSRLSGKVELRGLPSSRIVITVEKRDAPRTERYGIIAPVSADGSFVIDGVPRGQIDVEVVIQGVTGSNVGLNRLQVTEPVVSGLALTVPTSPRKLTVLVRSTVGVAPGNAQVLVLPGTQPSVIMARDLVKSFGTLGGVSSRLALPYDPTTAPIAASAARPGDLVVIGIAAPEGLASVCGVGLPADISDPSFAKALELHQDKIEVRCVPLPADSGVVVVEVPPWPRFD